MFKPVSFCLPIAELPVILRGRKVGNHVCDLAFLPAQISTDYEYTVTSGIGTMN